mmetsp:Transcript_34072/g.87893  ORF Transcript_34072/g.87893 Transcript_34072/m.87893 type:complete len:386 (-) Transcript_34072:428-1585(-)
MEKGEESLDLSKRDPSPSAPQRDGDDSDPASSSVMDVDVLLDPARALLAPKGGITSVLVRVLPLPSIIVLAFGLYDLAKMLADLTLFSLKEHTEISVAILIVLELIVVWWNLKSPTQVYLVDFATYKPPPSYKKSSTKNIRELFKDQYSEELFDFQLRVFERSGVGEEAYWPPGIWNLEFTMENARKEAEVVMFGALDDLFAKTGITPKDVDILIVNCSLFCPTPSLTSMIINHYKMKPSIQNYNLGGMGCSAGVVSIALANDLLKARKNCNAVVLSTENITMNWYMGKRKSMLLSNTLFRMGCGAVLLTNKPRSGCFASYTIQSYLMFSASGNLRSIGFFTLLGHILDIVMMRTNQYMKNRMQKESGALLWREKYQPLREMRLP